MSPTRAQLEAEPYWDREINTPPLLALEARLCRARGREITKAGGKGDIRHLSGGHRSQEWILHSAYCTNHTYTVIVGLTGEALRHIAAYDDIPGAWGTAANRAAVMGATKRLIAAARAGTLRGVTEILGTLDGVKAVRWLVVEGRYGTPPDLSHLDHTHLTFDRRRMLDAALMAHVGDLILGDEMEIDTVLPGNGRTVNDTLTTTMKRLPTDLAEVRPDLAKVGTGLIEVRADIAKLGTGGVDIAALVAAVRAGLREEIRAAVRAELDASHVEVTIGGTA